ncbi:sel1 repeat family protein [Brevundimonas naejangsanensis]|uniref:Sel1 repeat family protein n=1 Tax=Brevundimonas naejangsanensis TaxID=588932 RepID=A0A494RL24_9CAUL|nr:tetratricopeptide repeat protein [Brevundimonas naejangsanensis]AYG94436.1 sel1 repeat family protein [Brevundimonas naejangsanensis]
MLKTGPAALLAAGTIWLTWSPVQTLSPAPDPLDDALTLLQTDPAAAVAALERLADGGDVEATASLATALEITGGDPERSEHLWAQALQGGSQNARLNIGMRRLTNDDPADDAEAVAWLEGLDEMYQPVAAYPLGRAYLFGAGVQRDLERGTRLIQTAVRADPGNFDAQFLLGRAYQNGWGVPVDRDAARTHLTLAADSGDPRAQWNLGMLLISGGASSDVATAYRYVRQAAEQNFESGMISLAVMLARGQGVAPDAAEARLWYARAAEGGSAHALRGLGMMMLVGQGGASDPVKGAAYVELAAEGGDANAATLLRQFAEPLSQLPRADIDAAKAKWLRGHGAPR